MIARLYPHLPVPLAGAAGGFLASLAGWPLPWMVGSLLAVIALRCLSPRPFAELPGGRRVGQWLVACGIGLHFTREVFEQVLSHSALVLIGACLPLLLSLFGIVLLRRAGLDRPTAFFASMPGGASEMVNLGALHQANAAQVAAAHSLRLLLVVLLVPALFTWTLPPVPANAAPAADWLQLGPLMLAGALLALLWGRFKQPNPWMLGPLTACALASATFDLQLALPSGLGKMGQWLIGCALGCHFDRGFFARAARLLSRVVVSTLLAMLGALAVGAALASIWQQDIRSVMLGLMPGGIAELSLTAEALHLSVALVTALQVLRLFLVMFLAQPLYRLWSRF